MYTSAGFASGHLVTIVEKSFSSEPSMLRVSSLLKQGESYGVIAVITAPTKRLRRNDAISRGLGDRSAGSAAGQTHWPFGRVGQENMDLLENRRRAGANVRVQG